jgi:hypothetical protein
MILRFFAIIIIPLMWFGILLEEGLNSGSIIKIIALTWVFKVVFYDQNWRK